MDNKAGALKIRFYLLRLLHPTVYLKSKELSLRSEFFYVSFSASNCRKPFGIFSMNQKPLGTAGDGYSN